MMKALRKTILEMKSKRLWKGKRALQGIDADKMDKLWARYKEIIGVE